MSTLAANPTPDQQLQQLRRAIDTLDESLAKLLLERVEIIRQVAVLKSEHWPSSCHIRPGREGQMHQAIAARFHDTEIPVKAALAIWRQLIGSATQLESPLTAITLAQHPHHAWLAREYFGIDVGLRSDISVADMLDSLERKVGNILILPEPGTEGGDWWRDAALFRTHGLSIFATLPVTTDPLPNHAARAFALAPVACEASGDDVSYIALAAKSPIEASRLVAIAPMHVITHDPLHHLLVFDGFVTDASSELTALKKTLGDTLLSLTVLGTHPRPLTL